MWISAALLLSFGMTAFAQTIEISPVAVDRGSTNFFLITLKPRAEKPLAALQWDLVYRDYFRIEPSGVIPGDASENTGKSLKCVRKPVGGANIRLSCILAGGVQALPAGVLAVVRFEVIQDAPKGVGSVDLENVAGVSPALEPVPLKSTKSSFTIR